MVRLAQREQIVHIGPPQMFPPEFDVVDSAGGESDCAVKVAARAVHSSQCPSLLSVGGPFGASNVEDLAFTVQHSRQDLGVTAQPPDGGDR